MKTNIGQKTDSKNMHSHNVRIENFKKYYNLNKEEAESAIELLDKYLPHGYTEEVISLSLRNKTNVSPGSVRLIKGGFHKNSQVFKYLLEFAAECKANELAAHFSIKKNIST